MVDGTHIDEDELLKENFVLEAALVLAKSAADLKKNPHKKVSNTNEMQSMMSDDEMSGKS